LGGVTLDDFLSDIEDYLNERKSASTHDIYDHLLDMTGVLGRKMKFTPSMQQIVGLLRYNPKFENVGDRGYAKWRLRKCR